MPSKIASPSVQVHPEPLTQSSFSAFGHVIANPSKHQPGTTAAYQTTTANQGSATKYVAVSDLTNYYTLAASKKPARPSLNIFSCKPRLLRSSSGSSSNPAPGSAGPTAAQQRSFFDVRILERHPYTSQTFVPFGHAAADHTTRYLVVVAPTLPAARSRAAHAAGARPPAYPAPEPRRKRSLQALFSRARPSPFTNDATAPPPQEGRLGTRRGIAGPDAPRGTGMPDLANVKAFVAYGDQAVTYGPGTWHAPMVVLGREQIDFVVVQYANGVAGEDCQEVELEALHGEEGVAVCIDGLGDELSDRPGPRANL